MLRVIRNGCTIIIFILLLFNLLLLSLLLLQYPLSIRLKSIRLLSSCRFPSYLFSIVSFSTYRRYVVSQINVKRDHGNSMVLFSQKSRSIFMTIRIYLIYSILRFQIVYHLPTICLPFAYHLSPHHLIVYIPLFFAFVAYSI